MVKLWVDDIVSPIHPNKNVVSSKPTIEKEDHLFSFALIDEASDKVYR